MRINTCYLEVCYKYVDVTEDVSFSSKKLLGPHATSNVIDHHINIFMIFFFAEDETNACLTRCILTLCCKRLCSRDRSRSHATSNIDPLLWDLISSWICPAQHEYCGVPSDVEMNPTAFARRSIMNVVICYWCNWFICPITLETVVSPFLLGRSIHQPSDGGGVLRRNNEPTATALLGEGLSLLPLAASVEKLKTEFLNYYVDFLHQVDLYLNIFLSISYLSHMILFVAFIWSRGYSEGSLIYSATEYKARQTQIQYRSTQYNADKKMQ